MKEKKGTWKGGKEVWNRWAKESEETWKGKDDDEDKLRVKWKARRREGLGTGKDELVFEGPCEEKRKQHERERIVIR